MELHLSCTNPSKYGVTFLVLRAIVGTTILVSYHLVRFICRRASIDKIYACLKYKRVAETNYMTEYPILALVITAMGIFFTNID